jgi:exopolyphosphatase / guanosine-5'-triphosphate,3'-diphosphate pyrophosphatase
MANKNIYAAIDVGSNAIRFVIGKIDERKNILVNIYRERVPLRLGRDSFENGEISTATEKDLISTFERFQDLIETHEVPPTNICAVGTSALRDAKNKAVICEKILSKTSIPIKILTGLEEAESVYYAFKKSWHLNVHPLLFMDLGGGSLEFNLVVKKQLKYSSSINIGTVRLLLASKKETKIYESLIRDFEKQIAKTFSRLENISSGSRSQLSLVGTGGNLRCLGVLRKSILGKSSSDFAKKKDVEEILSIIKNSSIKTRIEEFEMRKDRAEVIEGALEIIDRVMTSGNFEKIYLPNIGLIHGILWQLYEKNSTKNQGKENSLSPPSTKSKTFF